MMKTIFLKKLYVSGRFLKKKTLSKKREDE